MFRLYTTGTVKAMQKQWQDSLKEKQKDIDGLNKIIETLTANLNEANRNNDKLTVDMQTALNNVTGDNEKQHARIKELEQQLDATKKVRDDFTQANWKLAEENKGLKELDAELLAKRNTEFKQRDERIKELEQDAVKATDKLVEKQIALDNAVRAVDKLKSQLEKYDSLVVSLEETKGGKCVVYLYSVDGPIDRLLYSTPRSRKSAGAILKKLQPLGTITKD